MSDLFGTLPQQAAPKVPRSVGYGNAMFLCDLADGASDDTMRAKFRAGEYPHIHTPSIPGWRALAGRR